MTDQELIARYKKEGDLTVLGTLYTRYLPLVLGCCLKYLKNKQDAQDASMQLFEQLIDKVKKNDIVNFKPWLYMVCRNYCLMQLRQLTHGGKFREVDFEETFMEFADDFHLDSIMENENVSTQLAHCIEALQKEQKKSILMFFFECVSYKQISETTGHDLKRIKSAIQNGKRNLKICLSKKGVMNYEL